MCTFQKSPDLYFIPITRKAIEIKGDPLKIDSPVWDPKTAPNYAHKTPEY
jgi:hypothetical protein